MKTRAERLPDGSNYVALLHGPIVLAAKTGTADVTGLIADDGRGSHIAPGAYLPLERAPMLVGETQSLVAHIEPIKDRPLTFKASTLIQPAEFRDLELQPLFRTHDARYMVYWRTATPAAYPAVLKEIEARERERQALDARTLDQVMPGEQQPEVDHLLKGEDLAKGIHLGRRWRDAGRGLSYQLKAPAGRQALELMFTFYGGDQNDGFKLLANEREIATIHLKGDRPDDFIDLTFALPPDLAVAARQDGIAVKLVSLGQRTARVFGIRLLVVD